jgi:hypothetical protein
MNKRWQRRAGIAIKFDVRRGGIKVELACRFEMKVEISEIDRAKLYRADECFTVSEPKQEGIGTREVGLVNIGSSPTSSIFVTPRGAECDLDLLDSSNRPSRRFATSRGSKPRLRLAGGVVGPGRCSKCADARRRTANVAVNVTRGGRGGGICCEMPGHMALASHGGSCEHGCSDQSSREKSKFGHSISPSDTRSQRALASPWQMRAAPNHLNAPFAHRFSTQREVEACRNHEPRRRLNHLSSAP